MNPNLESRDLSTLSPDFQPRAQALLDNCKARGVIMRPFFTVRGPGVQAKLWCQSRTRAQIEKQIQSLLYLGIPWIANLLNPKFEKSGPAVTNALPGMSWHQWGEAIDCFVLGDDGKAIWDARHKGYKVYAEEAKNLGLEAGGNWLRFPDAVHVQLRSAASPLKSGMTWKEVEAEMKSRFSK